jgi:hypothetical protein
MADTEPTPRKEIEFTLTGHSKGKIRIKIKDRINVDDVFLHHVNRHVYRLLTGDDPGDDVNPIFKDALIKDQFVVGER